jgi:hypothetical protein
MHDSKGSGDGQWSCAVSDRLTGWLVCRGANCGGQRENAGKDALGGLAAVPFQVKLAFESPVDRYDDLVQRLEQALPGTFRLALVYRAQQCQLTLGEIGLEVAAELGSCRR